MHEKPYRSVVKTISWRTLGTLDTIIISYFITGSLVMADQLVQLKLLRKWYCIIFMRELGINAL